MNEDTNKIFYAGTKDGKCFGFFLEKEGLQEGFSEITEEEHDALIKGNSEGKEIKFEKGKKPYLIDFVPTEEQALVSELDKLQLFLIETDYIASKIAEGVATKEEYKKELEERQKARKRINEIQSKLTNL